MTGKRSILSVTFEELKQVLVSGGQPAYRAKQVFDWVYERGATDFSAMTDLSKELREVLAEKADFPIFEEEVLVSADGTKKFRFKLSDGEMIESVWIPEERRNTLCISSQAGCPLKCAFCVTGLLGLKRNLSAEEIVAQVWRVRSVLKLPVTNIVMMGMGEPLLNFDNVVRAIAIMTDQQGMAIGKRKITVSTAGIAPKIKPFLEATGVKLAISLTGWTDEVRNHWMPINQKYNLAALKKELQSLHLPKGKVVMFEVVLMGGVNDSVEEAEKLADYLKGIPARVNLIRYNQNPAFPDLKRPSLEHTDRFQKALINRGIFTFLRKNRGEDVMAACGQLAGGQIESVREAEKTT